MLKDLYFFIISIIVLFLLIDRKTFKKNIKQKINRKIERMHNVNKL